MRLVSNFVGQVMDHRKLPGRGRKGRQLFSAFKHVFLSANDDKACNPFSGFKFEYVDQYSIRIVSLTIYLASIFIQRRVVSQLPFIDITYTSLDSWKHIRLADAEVSLTEPEILVISNFRNQSHKALANSMACLLYSF